MTEWRPCPFDDRLARTPYLVIPKMALQAMPLEWRERLDTLLSEADATGMETPSYHVFRDDPAYNHVTYENDEDEPYSPISSVEVIRSDPWANYRRATLARVQELSPGFKPVMEPAMSDPDAAVQGSEVRND